jgi:putative protease
MTKNYIAPELLSPAGDLEKLKIALLYGADAVYVGGHVFGLRRYATNFTLQQLKEGILFANHLNKKVYVVLNGFAHQSDLDALETHLNELEQLQPHGLIISDMGVFQLAKEKTTIPLHVSTQASVTHKYACQFWKDQGAVRVILAREVSISDCQQIKKFCDIDLEVFVHGAMCASYSGKCTISNYTAGRDSNRGGCIQSCRHRYSISSSDTPPPEASLTMMNAKDLMALYQLPDLIRAGIVSFKIEGRMKSNLYAANSTINYRKAIDMTVERLNLGQSIDPKMYLPFAEELRKVSNRTFSSGGFEDRLDGQSIHYDFNRYEKLVDYLGTVKDIQDTCIDDTMMVVAVKNSFIMGDSIELMSPNGDITPFTITTLFNSIGEPIQKTNPNSIVKINAPSGAVHYSILRKPITE